MRARSEAGQAIIVLLAAVLIVVLAAGSLGALGKALLGRGRYQRAADLTAVSAARSIAWPQRLAPTESL
jgi:hypothetical protein